MNLLEALQAMNRCPVCGHNGDIFEDTGDGTHYSYQERTTYVASCHHAECLLSYLDYHAETLEEAVEVWNNMRVPNQEESK